jgi:hypothetical protein
LSSLVISGLIGCCVIFHSLLLRSEEQCDIVHRIWTKINRFERMCFDPVSLWLFILPNGIRITPWPVD